MYTLYASHFGFGTSSEYFGDRVVTYCGESF